MARRRRQVGFSSWSWRLFGVVICAFFALGVAAGFGASNPQLSAQARETLAHCQRRALAALAPSLKRVAFSPPSTAVSPRPDGILALVERKDGFYALSDSGALRGPVSTDAEGDLPVLSGSTIDSLRAPDLLDYAARLIRAEAALSALISEMRIADGTLSVFLERSHTEIIFDREGWPLELEHASQLMQQWEGRERLIARLDMTTPGQAVVTLGAMSASTPANANASGRAIVADSREFARR